MRYGTMGAGAVVALAVSSASAQLDFSLTLDFELDNPEGTYNILPFFNTFGFIDDDHPDNIAEVNSPTGRAFGDGGSVGSDTFGTLAEMLGEANGTWTINTFDAVSMETREFEFDVTVDTMGLTEDYFRAFSGVNIMSGDTISDTPTLEWMLEPAAFAEAEYDSAFASVQGDAFVFDSIDPGDTSWSPSIAPLDEGAYSLFIFMLNNSNFDQSLVQFSDAFATDGGDDPDFFSADSGVRSTLALRNLLVVPSPASLAMFGVGGLVAVRRRR